MQGIVTVTVAQVDVIYADVTESLCTRTLTVRHCWRTIAHIIPRFNFCRSVSRSNSHPKGIQSPSNDTSILELILKNCFFYCDKDQPKITRVKDICETVVLSESTPAFVGKGVVFTGGTYLTVHDWLAWNAREYAWLPCLYPRPLYMSGSISLGEPDEMNRNQEHVSYRGLP